MRNNKEELADNYIHILNWGGLGNRINNIVNVIYLSSLLSRECKIYWPINNACHCPFSVLFSNKFNIDSLDGYEEPLTTEEYYEIFGEKCYFF